MIHTRTKTILSNSNQHIQIYINWTIITTPFCNQAIWINLMRLPIKNIIVTDTVCETPCNQCPQKTAIFEHWPYFPSNHHVTLLNRFSMGRRSYLGSSVSIAQVVSNKTNLKVNIGEKWRVEENTIECLG